MKKCSFCLSYPNPNDPDDQLKTCETCGQTDVCSFCLHTTIIDFDLLTTEPYECEFCSPTGATPEQTQAIRKYVRLSKSYS